MAPDDPTINKNNIDEKKLWFDYLARLRDREDRSNQITGVTNWVLCGLMGTLLYKAIGFLPLTIADKNYQFLNRLSSW